MSKSTDPPGRALIETAFARLRQTIEAKKVGTRLRQVALDALERARLEIELDPMWPSEQLVRVKQESR